jgi:hypothetical protein
MLKTNAAAIKYYIYTDRYCICMYDWITRLSGNQKRVKEKT